jgi:hypothetical protein
MKYIVYIANRWQAIMFVYIVSILAASMLFSHFEDRTLGDGLWWAVVTALTIGYGDLSPATVEGRITGILFGHFWIFGVIPMVVANIIMRMIENKDSFTHAEQEWQEDALQAIAEKVGITLVDPPRDY